MVREANRPGRGSGLYETYWKLAVKPFENTPDPDFLFESSEHEEGLERMRYASRERKGGCLLTGDYGCGKTLLIRSLIRGLPGAAYSTVLLPYPRLSGEELLRDILAQMAEETGSSSLLTLSRRIGNRLLAEAQAGKHTVLIIDEAQLIDDRSVLEELRLLMNHQLDDRFLLTLILVGQPELRERVAELPQLEQRLSVRFHLHVLDLQNTTRYIRHRMQVAGGSAAVFSPEATEEIYRFSYGSPRRVNNICDLCLLEGCRTGAKQISAEIVRRVV